MEYPDIYLFNSHPTTFPKCGNRSEGAIDLYDVPAITRYLGCLTIRYKLTYTFEEENLFQFLR